jgi:hypothetical protein
MYSNSISVRPMQGEKSQPGSKNREG